MLIDITKNMNMATEIYDGDPLYVISQYFSIARGDEFNVSKIEMGSHFATHIDAPKHFFDNGTDIAQLDINRICGKCRVVRVHQVIDEVFLKELSLEPESRVLFKTKGKFGVTKSAAEYMAGLAIRVVGTDAMDIEAENNLEFSVHKILLGQGIPIIEGLELCDVEEGKYRLWCLPLKMEGLDGVPVRVALEKLS